MSKITHTTEDQVAMTAEEQKKKRRGATLVEVMMYLGIAAFIIGSAIALYSLATASSRSNNLSTEIMTIVDQTHALYSGDATYANLTDTTLAQTGEFPARWVSAQGGNIISPWGQPIIVGVGAVNNIATIHISVPAVPRDACMKTSTYDFGNGLLERTPAPSAGNANAPNPQGVPLTPTDAIAGCKGATTPLTFDFE